MATMRRDDRKLIDERLIKKQRRRGHRKEYGCPWISSITSLTWWGIKHLIERHLLPNSAFKLWKEICGSIENKRPPEVREGRDFKRLSNVISGYVNGRGFKIPP